MLKRFIILMKSGYAMMIYLLGVLDILAGLSLFLLKLDVNFFQAFFATYLAVKGIAFIRNFASLADILCSLLFFYALYSGYFGIFAYIAMFWLLQKGIFSFFKLV